MIYKWNYLLFVMGNLGITSRPVSQDIEYVAPRFFVLAKMSAS